MYIFGNFNVWLHIFIFQMASFLANTIGLFWNDPLEELGNIFQPQNFPGVPELQVLKLLVQIFGYIPEQVI